MITSNLRQLLTCFFAKMSTYIRSSYSFNVLLKAWIEVTTRNVISQLASLNFNTTKSTRTHMSKYSNELYKDDYDSSLAPEAGFEPASDLRRGWLLLEI